MGYDRVTRRIISNLASNHFVFSQNLNYFILESDHLFFIFIAVEASSCNCFSVAVIFSQEVNSSSSPQDLLGVILVVIVTTSFRFRNLVIIHDLFLVGHPVVTAVIVTPNEVFCLCLPCYCSYHCTIHCFCQLLLW